jgi:hypothetical protein
MVHRLKGCCATSRGGGYRACTDYGRWRVGILGRAARGGGSKTKGLPMAFKLLDIAQQPLRRLDGVHLLPLVRAGVKFADGVRLDRSNPGTPSTDNQPREEPA